MPPIVYYLALLPQEPQISLQIGANDLVFGILTVLFTIIGVFFARYMRQQDKNYEKLEIRIDTLDSRIDKIEVSNTRILTILESRE